MKASQRVRIAGHLLAGMSITQEQARARFGCWRLADVIWKLKNGVGAPNGHTMPIVTEMVKNAEGNPFAKYRIERKLA